VLVIGAVTDPGLIALRRTQCNMLYAIAAAGGVSGIASGKATLRRIRDPGVSVTFDLRDAVQLQQAVDPQRRPEREPQQEEDVQGSRHDRCGRRAGGAQDDGRRDARHQEAVREEHDLERHKRQHKIPDFPRQ